MTARLDPVLRNPAKARSSVPKFMLNRKENRSADKPEEGAPGASGMNASAHSTEAL